MLNIKKRVVDDVDCSPLIKTLMTRCIHCTRCVRFLQEVIGDYALGTVGRGNTMEIYSYTQNMLVEEMSGNIIDLCPVGALTAKPFAFVGRSWEPKLIYSIDILDSFCSNIRLDVYNNKILRILPELNPFLNEEWITNKIRFCIDSFNKQRLVVPRMQFYYNKTAFFLRCSWEYIFSFIYILFFQYYIKNIELFFGPLIDEKSLIAIKDFSNMFGIVNFSFLKKNVDYKHYYIYDSSLLYFRNLTTLVFLVLILE